MSTISTHLNWGSSYAVHDFYKRFLRPEASEKEQVWAGRFFTVGLMILSGFMALALTNAKQLFDIIIMFGAGTGLIFILRWFWWRINAWSEITGMFVSGLTSLAMSFVEIEGVTLGARLGVWKFPVVVGVTTAAWILTTYLTPKTDTNVLKAFYLRTLPGGPGWNWVRDELGPDTLDQSTEGSPLGTSLICMLLGCVMVYFALFATGYWIYGQYILAATLTGLATVSGISIAMLWKKMNLDDADYATTPTGIEQE